ncbi:MAG: hypothetical protein NC089_00305 [Bacteroides sp.]|nr:hypothetical protein [Bacteroides sp.]MCM1549346.1 hypothetical protein [Clostridium sp.]
MKKNQKVIKFHNVPVINIGVIIFGLIFIFLGVQIFRSLRQVRVSVYEVQKSYMDTNITGSAIALRQEVLVAADRSGYINYYIRNGQKVGKNATVYTLDATGSLADIIADASGDGVTLNTAGYHEIKTRISAFQNYFSDVNFSDVYDFKNDLDSQILDLINSQVLEDLTSADGTMASFSQITSSESGVVTYYQDGYEGKQPEEITLADYERDTYTSTSLKTGEIIQAGSPVYKLITSDIWNLVLPLSQEDAERLQADDRVTLRMPNVVHEVYGDITVIQNGEAYFANITLDKLMVNYCEERFLPIEIVMTQQEGLTIPNSAIVEKQVLKLPIDYLTAGSNSSQMIYFNVRILDEEGNLSVMQVAPDIYEKDDLYCYVNPNAFAPDAVLVKNDSDQTLSLTDAGRENRTGVYSVNRGSASFRPIEILASDSDFSIISESTSYGIALYDRIVLDSSTVEEGQIIY